jgi:hypothetical protein
MFFSFHLIKIVNYINIVVKRLLIHDGISIYITCIMEKKVQEIVLTIMFWNFSKLDF